MTSITAMSLHIGVGSVDRTHYGTSGKLAGAENDAKRLDEFAESRGFTVRSRLVGKDASAANIIAGIEKAANTLGSGGTFLLTYSGHGGQIEDLEGDEGDPGGGRDEGWCAIDRMVLDDEIFEALSKFATGVHVIVIVDSCHAGSPLQIAVNESSWTDAFARTWYRVIDGRPKQLSSDEMKYAYTKHRTVYDAVRTRLAGKVFAVQANAIQLSACEDWETTPDGKPNSLFTRLLLSELKSRGSQHSWKSLHQALVAQSKRRTPQFRIIGTQDAAYESRVPLLNLAP